MFWEEELMKECVGMLGPKGDVLEVGFGSGFGANEIQAVAPKSHTIVESHKGVADRARFWADGFKGTKIVEGPWQKNLASLGKYDAIFIDDYPLEQETGIISSPALPHSEVDRSKEASLQSQVNEVAPLAKMKISKTDIETMLAGAEAMEPEYLLNFLYEMRKTGVLNDADLSYAFEKGIAMGKFSKEVCETFKAEQLAGHDYNRLFTFMNECVKDHLNAGGVIVTYLDDPSFKKKNPELFKIAGATVTEKMVAVKRPEHNLFFPTNQALILKVQKVA